VADPARPDAMRSDRHSHNNEAAVGPSNCATASSFDIHLNVGEGLLGPGINDSSSYYPRDFLRADRNGPHETNDKREQ
jgi:hypothetical protein